TQKHAQAVQKVHERRAPAHEACGLFRNFLAAETKFVNALEEHGGTCGAPPEVLKQGRDGHARSSQLANRLCEAAALGARPAGPSLFDRPAGPSPGEMWPKGDFWRPGEFERLKGPLELR